MLKRKKKRSLSRPNALTNCRTVTMGPDSGTVIDGHRNQDHSVLTAEPDTRPLAKTLVEIAEQKADQESE